MFKSIAESNGIHRARVVNPDPGAMPWYKDFNILDLGMLGSPVLAQLSRMPVVADHILGFVRHDLSTPSTPQLPGVPPVVNCRTLLDVGDTEILGFCT